MQDESRSLGGEVAIDMDSRANPLQLQLIDEQDSYIQSRADTMQNIESTIVELGSIFQQLAHMVKEQEETIQRSDKHIHTTGFTYSKTTDSTVQYMLQRHAVQTTQTLTVAVVFFFKSA
uniref:t-SNARE coiled-coil homology domain-containing protein n=1 Tax=Sinocyclocheilus grahami TaxID=75366 RepID=A0A672Q2H1_SINGR